MSETDQIRILLNDRIEALGRRDAAAANQALDSCLVAFELAGALQLPSAEATDTAQTQAWLDSFGEGPSVTMEELTIHAEGSVAFCHSLNRLRGRRKGGEAIDVIMRSTLGLLKRNGQWKIIHGHTSFPR